jgi:hypothetical protein
MQTLNGGFRQKEIGGYPLLTENEARQALDAACKASMTDVDIAPMKPKNGNGL